MIMYQQDAPDQHPDLDLPDSAAFEPDLPVQDPDIPTEPSEDTPTEPLDTSVEPADTPQDLPDHEVTRQQVLEALLFAADEPVPPRKLAEIAGHPSVKEVRQEIDQLNELYDRENRAFRIEEIAGGYQMLTRSAYNPWLHQLLKVRSESKLSPAALETLAVVAYKQPVMRVDVEAIRGVGCGEMIRQLCEKGLVKIVGRAEELGRPLLYGTTRKFLEAFGLANLKDLPQVEDLKKPDK